VHDPDVESSFHAAKGRTGETRSDHRAITGWDPSSLSL
jgi:hypothetical protein